MTIPDVSDREDCTEMHIPANCRGSWTESLAEGAWAVRGKGWVTGNRGSELRRMEHERLGLEVDLERRYSRDLKRS